MKGRKNLARHHREVAVLCAESLVRAKLEGRDAGPVQRSGKCSRGPGRHLESQVRTATGGAATIKWSGFYPGDSGRFRRTVGRGISEQFYILEDLPRG